MQEHQITKVEEFDLRDSRFNLNTTTHYKYNDANKEKTLIKKTTARYD